MEGPSTSTQSTPAAMSGDRPEPGVVRSRDGIVELSGMTRTERSRTAIEGLVRGVRGVLGVRNELGTFEALGAAPQALRQGGGPAMRVVPDASATTPLRRDGSSPADDGASRPDAAGAEPGPGAGVERPTRIAA